MFPVSSLAHAMCSGPYGILRYARLLGPGGWSRTKAWSQFADMVSSFSLIIKIVNLNKHYFSSFWPSTSCLFAYFPLVRKLNFFAPSCPFCDHQKFTSPGRTQPGSLCCLCLKNHSPHSAHSMFSTFPVLSLQMYSMILKNVFYCKPALALNIRSSLYRLHPKIWI